MWPTLPKWTNLTNGSVGDQQQCEEDGRMVGGGQQGRDRLARCKARCSRKAPGHPHLGAFTSGICLYMHLLNHVCMIKSHLVMSYPRFLLVPHSMKVHSSRAGLISHTPSFWALSRWDDYASVGTTCLKVIIGPVPCPISRLRPYHCFSNDELFLNWIFDTDTVSCFLACIFLLLFSRISQRIAAGFWSNSPKGRGILPL